MQPHQQIRQFIMDNHFKAQPPKKSFRYKRMDNMVVFLTNDSMVLLLEGAKPKFASRKNNEQQYQILEALPDITREEFEAKLKTKSAEEATFELSYWAEVSQ